jgi:hypothetical protein
VDDPFIFRGPVNEAGYEWLEGEDGKPRLVPRRTAGVGFRPCETHPGLFREFAELTPTRDAIQSFAGKYGDLFSRYDAEQSVARDDRTVAFGASLGTWRQEIGDMRILVSLWDRIKHNPPQLLELQKIITRTEKELRYVIVTPKRKADVTLAHADIPASGLSRFDPEDVLQPAMCALQLEINKRLAETPTIPRLAWTPDYHQRIIFVPDNLLAAMWMQFAQDMTGEFQLIKCEGCGGYFQRGPGAKRSDATTHGDACRQLKKRKLKKPS